MKNKYIAKNLTNTLIVSSLLLNAVQADVLIGNDLNSADSANAAIADLYSANRGSNGGGDQSLQFGDVIHGTEYNDLIVGGLGIDVLFGGPGDDFMIGGTEDFNSFNRDRAFGQEGDDTFLWSPGDGNDFFDGGPGLDVVMLSLIGESQDANGNTDGAPFFAVNPPGTVGSQDFDGIFEVQPGVPQVDFTSSPGFCEIVERDADNKAGLDELGLDHLIRFVLRGPRARSEEVPEVAAALDNETALVDDGLRVALHLKNVEYLACTNQNPSLGARIFDLTQVPAQEVDISELPANAAALVYGANDSRIEIIRR